ncbi:hypothetical protein HUJ04_007099 [Dendroctonus ponderosae]|nr:hypothetical protein HUJ04_007099 [Dendroctonus ponderosae]
MPTVEPLSPGPHIQKGDQAFQPPVLASSLASNSLLLVLSSKATANSAVASVRMSGVYAIFIPQAQFEVLGPVLSRSKSHSWDGNTMFDTQGFFIYLTSYVYLWFIHSVAVKPYSWSTDYLLLAHIGLLAKVIEQSLHKYRYVQKNHRNKPPQKYLIDNLAEQYGHKVLRLPPYHCVFNPIEHVWGLTKNYYNKHIGRDGTTATSCLNMWDEALTTVTPEIWKNCIRHTEDEIPKWYAREHLFDRQEILPIVINVDDDDDSDFDFTLASLLGPVQESAYIVYPFMDPNDKIEYLIQATVSGSRARQLVESYPAMGENYNKIIQSLQNRFGRGDLQIEIYVRGLLKLVLSNSASREKLDVSVLYDSLETQLRALETLGITSDKYAAMLFPLIESCLPHELLRVWQRSTLFITVDSSERPGDVSTPPLEIKLRQLMAFLKQEVDNEQRLVLAAEGFGLAEKTSFEKNGEGNSRMKLKKNPEYPTAIGLLRNIKAIKNIGLNRVCIKFISAEAANLFIKNKNLEGKGYNVFIPLNFTTSKGLVREIDLDFSETELLESCSCKSDIINIKRLNRKIFRNDKIEYLPAGTCLFTFKGTIMPKEIEFFRLPLPVSMYIPSVTQCFSCLLYGHTKKNCKGQKNCFNCGEKNAQSHKIMITGEDKPAYTCDTKCHFCHEPHKSSYKKMSRIHEITRY